MATKTRKIGVRVSQRQGARRQGAPRSNSGRIDFPDLVIDSHVYMMLLGLKPSEAPALWQRVTDGLEYKALEHFQHYIGLPVKDVVGLLQIPQSTLVRRKKAGQLGPLESDRLVRFGRLLGMAVEMFEGNVDAARQWLMAPQRALDGVTPLQMARTEVGAREVEQLIGRLEHGVFS